MEYESYRAIKLLEHAMKVIEDVSEQRIREKVKIRISLDLCQEKELLIQSSLYARCRMQSSLYDRYRRNVGVMERSCTLILYI